VSPVATPPAPPFLTADWRWLVMLNYAVDPALLRPLVPTGTELDEWGRRHVRQHRRLPVSAHEGGIPIPFHRDFEELNVRRKGPEGWRRAAWCS
jgi:uncharacterized protein